MIFSLLVVKTNHSSNINDKYWKVFTVFKLSTSVKRKTIGSLGTLLFI